MRALPPAVSVALLTLIAAACSGRQAPPPPPPPPDLPEIGVGSLSCCEPARRGGPAVPIAVALDALGAAELRCTAASLPAPTVARAVHACMARQSQAAVRVCVRSDDVEDAPCELLVRADRVAGRTLLGFGVDVQMDDYTWAVADLRAEGGPALLYPQAAPYLEPFCNEDMRDDMAPDMLRAYLAGIPASRQEVPPEVHAYVCAGPHQER